MTDNQLIEMGEAKYPFEYGVWDSKTAHERRAYIAGYKEAIEEMGKGWVSVDERLPEENILVLAYWGLDQIRDIAKWNGEYWVDSYYDGDVFESDPTDWMPLPAAPSINKGETTH